MKSLIIVSLFIAVIMALLAAVFVAGSILMNQVGG